MIATAHIVDNSADTLIARFHSRRQYSLALAEPLTSEDMQLQSMPDASPTKWHLAHTTWFFEQFILLSFVEDYQSPQPQFNYLFNSYYEQKGERYPRAQRGMISRPGIEDVYAYRKQIDSAIEQLLTTNTSDELVSLIELGMNHEMQHQELLLTDILHAFSLNPLYPAAFNTKSGITELSADHQSASEQFIRFDAGLHQFGVAPQTDFYFDCEGPKHKAYVSQFALAKGLVTNADWLLFIEAGGYQNPVLWLADGWAVAQQEGWQCPLYWRKQGDAWYQFTLNGLVPLALNAPVSHISYYEADAYAQWKGCRLPTEYEWELAAREQAISGNFSEKQIFSPMPCAEQGVKQLYGDVWEWTRSPYTPYPGYKAPEGAVGEYNGKFMSGQYVLRGGSCVTPIEQMRSTYRTFFYPHQRWQFMGLRLAKDC